VTEFLPESAARLRVMLQSRTEIAQFVWRSGSATRRVAMPACLQSLAARSTVQTVELHKAPVLR